MNIITISNHRYNLMAHWAVFFCQSQSSELSERRGSNFGQESKKKLLGIDGNENFNLKQ